MADDSDSELTAEGRVLVAKLRAELEARSTELHERGHPVERVFITRCPMPGQLLLASVGQLSFRSTDIEPLPLAGWYQRVRSVKRSPG